MKTMTKSLFLLSGFVMLLCVAVLSTWALMAKPPKTGESTRHYEKVGGFSYVPPAGWEVRDLPAMRNKVVIGPRIGGFIPNIVVVDEMGEGSLEDYAKESIKTLRQFKGFKIVEQTDHDTTDGTPFKRLIVTDEQYGNKLRQGFYMFARDEKKIAVTFTAPLNVGDRYDPVIDATLKTFRFEKN